MAEAPVPDRPNFTANAPEGLKVPGVSRRCASGRGAVSHLARVDSINDPPMAVLDWHGRRHFAFGERPREAST
jgi:hypothetical protein